MNMLRNCRGLLCAAAGRLLLATAAWPLLRHVCAIDLGLLPRRGHRPGRAAGFGLLLAARGFLLACVASSPIFAIGISGTSTSICVPGAGALSILCRGQNNYSGGNLGVVAGGDSNYNNSDWSTISGGHLNFILPDPFVSFNPLNANVIGGGYYNRVSTTNFSVIGGGTGNLIKGTINGNSGNATIGGGFQNTISNNAGAGGVSQTVAGGENNTADKTRSTVGGGGSNQATGAESTVPGGFNNVASGDDSFACGSNATAASDDSFVCSDGASASDNGVDTFNLHYDGGYFFDAGTVRITSGAATAPSLITSSSIVILAGGIQWPDLSVTTTAFSGSGGGGGAPSGPAGGALSGTYPNPDLVPGVFLAGATSYASASPVSLYTGIPNSPSAIAFDTTTAEAIVGTTDGHLVWVSSAGTQVSNNVGTYVQAGLLQYFSGDAWVLDTTGSTIYRMDRAGNLTTFPSIGVGPNDCDPSPNFLYCAGSNSDLYIISPDGSISAPIAFPVSQLYNVRVVGSTLWVTDSTGLIFLTDLSGNILDTYTSGFGTGFYPIRQDNSGNVWINHSPSDTIYTFQNVANVITPVTSYPATVPGDFQGTGGGNGMTFDGVNIQMSNGSQNYVIVISSTGIQNHIDIGDVNAAIVASASNVWTANGVDTVAKIAPFAAQGSFSGPVVGGTNALGDLGGFYPNEIVVSSATAAGGFTVNPGPLKVGPSPVTWYYCTGSTAGTFDGNIARGNSNAGACAGGTWTATLIQSQ